MTLCSPLQIFHPSPMLVPHRFVPMDFGGPAFLNMQAMRGLDSSGGRNREASADRNKAE